MHSEMMIKFNRRAIDRKLRKYGKYTEIKDDEEDVLAKDTSGLFDDNASIFQSDDDNDSDFIDDVYSSEDIDEYEEDNDDERKLGNDDTDQNQMRKSAASSSSANHELDMNDDESSDDDDVKSTIESVSSRSSDSTKYIPEFILDEQYVDDKKQYKIGWKGYENESDNTWQWAAEYDNDPAYQKLVADWDKAKTKNKYIVKHFGKKNRSRKSKQ